MTYLHRVQFIIYIVFRSRYKVLICRIITIQPWKILHAREQEPAQMALFSDTFQTVLKSDFTTAHNRHRNPWSPLSSEKASNKLQISMLFRSTKVFLLNFVAPALGIYSQDPGLVSGVSDRASIGETKIFIRQA